MENKILNNKNILFEDNKKVLVQIGKNFFELKLFKRIESHEELKTLIDSQKYKLELLREDSQ